MKKSTMQMENFFIFSIFKFHERALDSKNVSPESFIELNFPHESWLEVFAIFTSCPI